MFSGEAGRNPQPAPAAPAGGAPSTVASLDGRYRDGGYVGDAVDTYYGPLQVKANVSGGRMVSIDVLQYPADRRASQRINGEALPELQSEVISFAERAAWTSSPAPRSPAKPIALAGCGA